MLQVFRFLDRAVVLIGLIVTLSMVAYFGFYLESEVVEALVLIQMTLAGLYATQEVYRWLQFEEKKHYFQERWYEASLLVLLAGLVAGQLILIPEPSARVPMWIGGLGSILLFGLFSSAVSRVETKVSRSSLKLRPAQVFLLSFTVPIFIGAALLKLPKASTFAMSWVDAFFMSTSALCVTGLAVFDLSGLTFLGKVVILGLIQLGGLGIMTLSLAFAGVVAGGLGVRDRLMLSEMFSEDRLSEVKNLLVRILGFTFFIEAVGAIALFYFSRLPGHSMPQGFETLFSAIFHAVSAFCNAGFSLASESLYHSDLRSNLGFIVVIMTLIVFGGLGFPTLSNLQACVLSRYGKHSRQKVRLSLSSKIVLVTTSFLLISGAGLIYLFEGARSFSGLTTGEQVLQSFFLSITSRTAGFNAWPTESISLVTMFMVIFLMWVGGSPMSTAGGVKVTTLFVSALNLKAFVSGARRLEAFGREISESSVQKAFAVVALSLSFIFGATLVLIYLEPELNPVDLVFEVVSAISTVGLSRGVTVLLSEPSKVVITLLMFIGRVGALTVLMAFLKPPKSQRYKLLKDDVMIG